MVFTSYERRKTMILAEGKEKPVSWCFSLAPRQCLEHCTLKCTRLQCPHVATGESLNVHPTIRPIKKAHCWIRGEGGCLWCQAKFRHTKIHNNEGSCSWWPQFAVTFNHWKRVLRATVFPRSNLEKPGSWQVEQLCLPPGYFCCVLRQKTVSGPQWAQLDFSGRGAVFSEMEMAVGWCGALNSNGPRSSYIWMLDH